MTQAGLGENPAQEITQTTTEVAAEETAVEETTEKQVLPPVNDEITLKQEEMRDTTVFVQTCRGSGSGTIINCLETETEGTFEYLILTNAHVTYSRFITIIRKVDSLTGRIKAERVDTGCGVIAFDHTEKDWFPYNTTVIAEDMQYDFSLLSFRSDHQFAVAKMANEDMLSQVRVFDEIFTIGCQLGRAPSPTTGIISQIITGNNGEKEWVIYGNTAQITPGSSGGGLFKKYDDHYYMIGIPFRVAITNDGQIIPHLAHAISIGVAKDFINQNAVTCP
jgi:S1-C subfamily serine protease